MRFKYENIIKWSSSLIHKPVLSPSNSFGNYRYRKFIKLNIKFNLIRKFKMMYEINGVLFPSSPNKNYYKKFKKSKNIKRKIVAEYLNLNLFFYI